LSQIITCKYQFGLPLYRQETMLSDIGIELSRQTMSSWILRCATLLEPLYMRLKEVLLAEPAIHADETPLKVIKAEKATSYMWVYIRIKSQVQDNYEASSQMPVSHKYA